MNFRNQNIFITDEGVQSNPDKYKRMTKFRSLESVMKIREFLGLTSYYRKFIQNYSIKAKSLTILLQNSIGFKRGPDQEKAFTTMKEELSQFFENFPLP